MTCSPCSFTPCLTCIDFEEQIMAEQDPAKLLEIRRSLMRQKIELNASWGDKFASFLVEQAFTVRFFFFCVCLTLIPLAFPAIDRYIQYVSSAFLQLIFLPLIGIATTRQEKINESRDERKYRIMLVSERLDELKDKV